MKLRAIPFEILSGAGLDTKNKNVCGGAFAKKIKCMGGVREKKMCGGRLRIFPVRPPLRISNGIALSPPTTLPKRSSITSILEHQTDAGCMLHVDY